ncbi:MAG: hypothetical protein K0S25_1982 [Bacillus sp. (in: firmicutes)]|nr:hypothetical protein [Bacillus sp. (in: firmicutes)]
MKDCYFFIDKEVYWSEHPGAENQPHIKITEL